MNTCVKCGAPIRATRKYCSRDCMPGVRMSQVQREAIAALAEVGVPTPLIARATGKQITTIRSVIRSFAGGNV